MYLSSTKRIRWYNKGTARSRNDGGGSRRRLDLVERGGERLEKVAPVGQLARCARLGLVSLSSFD